MRKRRFQIQACKEDSLWFFDEPVLLLKHEAFVQDASAIITRIVGDNQKANIRFSNRRFPGWTLRLRLLRKSGLGGVYQVRYWTGVVLGQAYLCGVLRLYFNKVPRRVFADVWGC